MKQIVYGACAVIKREVYETRDRETGPRRRRAMSGMLLASGERGSRTGTFLFIFGVRCQLLRRTSYPPLSSLYSPFLLPLFPSNPEFQVVPRSIPLSLIHSFPLRDDCSSTLIAVLVFRVEKFIRVSKRSTADYSSDPFYDVSVVITG